MEILVHDGFFDRDRLTAIIFYFYVALMMITVFGRSKQILVNEMPTCCLPAWYMVGRGVILFSFWYMYI